MKGSYGSEHVESRRCGALLAAALAIATVMWLGIASIAHAQSDQVVISSAGPLTQIYLNNDLACQIQDANDTDGVFFGVGDTDPGSCGTFMQINANGGFDDGAAELFGTEAAPAGLAAVTSDFTPVGAQTLTGTGTSADPYTVRTEVAACTTPGTSPVGDCSTGDSELALLTEVDTYVVGRDEYDTTLTVDNESGGTLGGTLYHTGDCYLQVDEGYGALGGANHNAPECTITPNDTPPGQVMSFVPVSGPASNYYEGAYEPAESPLNESFWGFVTPAGTPYPDTIDATSDEDNGMGLSWEYSIASGGNTTIAYSTLVSSAPPGVSAGPPSVTTGGAAFQAAVNPDGLATTVHFEYGLDPKYGLTTASDIYVDSTPDQAAGAGSLPIPVTATATGLVPHALYHFRVVATNAAGTVTTADQTFTTASLPPPPAPVLGKEANLTPVSGVVYVEAPPGALSKGQRFIPLTEARQLPVGIEVDARAGKLKLTTATTAGKKGKRTKTQSGDFSRGLFGVFQSDNRRLKGLTVLTLLDSGIFPGAPSYRRECAAIGKTGRQIGADDNLAAFQRRKLSHKVLQTLLSNEHGNYETKGKYSAATVRGTVFTVSDRCDGTLTIVKRGTVVVTDFRRRKNIAVHTGQEYLATAP
jgi:hypothetical protein